MDGIKSHADMVKYVRANMFLLKHAAAASKSKAAKPASVPLPVCAHLGEVIEKLDPGGRPCWKEGVWLRECKLHGECRTERESSDKSERCCRTCLDSVASERLDSILADIRGPLVPRSDEWIRRPEVQAAHRALYRDFLDSLPPDDGTRQGNGIVIVGGGRYEMGIYIGIKMLRHVGCELPVQVWHRGDGEPVGSKIRALPGVTVIDATAHPCRPQWRSFGGWEMKRIAGLWSGFRRWVYSDADNYFVADPACLFRALESTSAVLFPDYASEDDSPRWESFGLKEPFRISVNGGSAAYDYSQCRKAVWLAHHFDMHSDFWYRKDLEVGGFGDQDMDRMGFAITGTPFIRFAERPLRNVKGTLVQAGPDGRALCVHRIIGKPAPKGTFTVPMKRLPTLPRESLAWKFRREFESD